MIRFFRLLAISSLSPVVRLVALIAALTGCASFGTFATTEDQRTWSHPCEIRDVKYELLCIDDPTIEGAAAACPCHPESIYEHFFVGDPDAGTKDTGHACDMHEVTPAQVEQMRQMSDAGVR